MRDSFAVLLATSVIGCAPETAPEPLEVASRTQIASGRFSSITLDGSVEEGARVVALGDSDSTGGELTLFPFGSSGEPCAAGHAATFRAFGVRYAAGVRLSERPIRVEYYSDLDSAGSGPLRYIDAGCTVRPPTLQDDVVRPTLLGFERPGEVYARTVTGDVVRLDPWQEQASTIARNVSHMFMGLESIPAGIRTRLWLIESDELVIRSSEGEELGRAGQGVREVSVLAPWEGTEAAFVDAEGLKVLRDFRGSPTLIATDACEPEYLFGIVGFMNPSIAYLSPCLERTLNIADLETGESYAYVTGVGSVRQLWNWIFYVLGPDARTKVGELWAVRPDDTPELVGQSGDIGRVSPLGQDNFLVLIDVVDDSGSLGIWHAETGFLELARDVADFVVHDRILVLEGFDGATGTLQVLDPWTRSIELTVQGVPRGGYRMSEAVRAIDYLEDYDPQARVGRLRTFMIEDRRSFTVDENVSQFREIMWPDAGMLYTIGRGQREGIWIADWAE